MWDIHSLFPRGQIYRVYASHFPCNHLAPGLNFFLMIILMGKVGSQYFSLLSLLMLLWIGVQTPPKDVWILLNMNGGLLGLVNVYASNDTREHAKVWISMVDEL
jgi:hypothetical protein